MALKLKPQDKQIGFTIIEVVIVLAIAALILLIVFLAVPALQRNQRNTARKSDIGRIGAAATEFVSNNNGKLPAVSDASQANSDAQKIRDAAGNLNQYDFTVATGAPQNLKVVANSAAKVTILNIAQIARIAVCDTSNPGAVTGTGATAKQMALMYATEISGGGTQSLCQDI